MTKFIHSVLSFYKVAPSQLSAVAWRTVLGFEALCDLYAPEACQVEVFSAAYSLRKTTQGAHYFIPQSGVEKVIVNMVDIDCDMQDIVVRVTGSWEADSEDERGAVPVAWNLDAGSQVGLCLPLMLKRS